MIKHFTVNVSRDLRLGNRIGLSIAISFIPLRERRGATRYWLHSKSDVVNGRRDVVIAAEYTEGNDANKTD